jgi:hypothetical protein
MPGRFCEPLMKVAYKLLSRDEATFGEFWTPSEQKLWNSFETDQIYRLLTGESDTVPEFRFNWYTVDITDRYCEQPQRQPVPRAPTPGTRTAARTPAPAPVPLPAIPVKPPKASTSAQLRLPSSTTSSNTSSRPSTTLHRGRLPLAPYPEQITPRVLTQLWLHGQRVPHRIQHRADLQCHHRQCRLGWKLQPQNQQRGLEDYSDFAQMWTTEIYTLDATYYLDANSF